MKGAACNKCAQEDFKAELKQCTVKCVGREAEHYVGLKEEIAHCGRPTVGERELCRM